jgi:hypothetical protein
VLSHWLGLIGEGLNFLGALVMALDIFLRQKEHVLKARLDQLMQFAQVNGLSVTTYKGRRLASNGFSEKIVNRRSIAIAYGGVALLAAGFFCLALHHGLEIRDARQRQGIYVRTNNGFATFFRISETNHLQERN